MIVYNKYINNEDYTWYDSSNVIFSKCYDNNSDSKTLKIVFKDGRTSWNNEGITQHWKETKLWKNN